MARGSFSAYAIVTLVVTVMMTLGMAEQHERQQDPTTCLTRLVPCLNYLNSSRGEPPRSCCNPLKSAIKSNPECLCALISTRVTDQARRAGINVDRASELPGKCGQHVNPLGCLKSAGNSQNSGSDSVTGNRFMVLSSLWVAFAWALSAPS